MAMNKRLRKDIPLFGSLQEHSHDGAVGILPSGERDSFINTDEAYCRRCGKFTPGKARNGWSKDVVQLAGPDGVEGCSDCEVCLMLHAGLVAYRNACLPLQTLPTAISVQCVPGRTFKVSKASLEAKEKDGTIAIRTAVGGDAVSTTAKASGWDEVLERSDLEFFVRPEDASALEHVAIGRPVSRDISAPECITLARHWLSECQSNHPKTCSGSSASPLPTRVLDVGSAIEEPRLVEASGSIGPYAALSHCWGKVQPLTTTTTNLAAHLSAVPLDKLPKTFREAVLVTRQLGLQYIWIDSLCIIQDSAVDWEAQSAKMAEVYSGATITIAATSAADGRKGLFVDKASWNVSVPFQTTNARGQPMTVYVRRADNDNAHDISDKRLFEAEPLSRRGWVLQERLLSRRVLMYTACELVFECRAELWCECGEFPHKDTLSASKPEEAERSEGPIAPESVVGEGSRHRLSFSRWLRNITRAHDQPQTLGRTTPAGTGHAAATNARDALDAWQTIVQLYTRRCLTYDKDALPALSGLAKTTHSQLQSDSRLSATKPAYLAGLWRADLHRQLLWSKAPSGGISFSADEYALLTSLPDAQINQTYLPFKTRRNAEAHCPPSWSWASVRGAVWYGGKWLSGAAQLRDLAEFREASCTPASSANEFGSVSAGHLLARAYLAPVKLGEYEVDLKSLLHRCRVGEVAAPAAKSGGGAAGSSADSAVAWNREEWAVLDLPPATPLGGRQFWRLKVAEIRPPHLLTEIVDYANRTLLGRLAGEIASSHTVLYHLLLERELDAGSGGEVASFKRVGVFVKTVPRGEKFDAGKRQLVKLI